MANTTFPDSPAVCECGHADVTHWRYTGECMASTDTETWVDADA